MLAVLTATGTATLEMLLDIEPLWLKTSKLHRIEKTREEEPYDNKVLLKDKESPWNRGKLRYTLMQDRIIRPFIQTAQNQI